MTQSITSSYIDTASNKIAIATPNNTSTVAQALKSKNIPLEHLEIKTNNEKPELYSRYFAGERYFIDNGFACSTSFSVVSSKNSKQEGFLTAGHCASKGAKTTSLTGENLGTFVASSFPKDDMAWVSTEISQQGVPGVTMHNQNFMPVRGDAEMPINSYVCRSGGTTGWHCGYILAKNQIVNYPQGLVAELIRTNACAEPGDSGGAWISGDQAQGITSGGSGNCTTGGVTYYQPIQEPLKKYGLKIKIYS